MRGRSGPATASVGVGVRPGTGGGGEPTAYARTVLDVVRLIPRGRVMTYGDVAEFLGTGTPRTVGTALRCYGSEVAWWRVVQAGGRPAEPHVQEALGLLAKEGTPVRDGRVELARARWDGQPISN